jgi:hypothetical protein
VAAPINPADLARHLERYGSRATVITVAADRRPHVGTSLVAFDDDRLVLRVGSRAASNLELQPDLCLTWAPPVGDNYQLIVDGSAVEVAPDGDAFRVLVAVNGGIRHRIAEATGPSCIPLERLEPAE